MRFSGPLWSLSKLVTLMRRLSWSTVIPTGTGPRYSLNLLFHPGSSRRKLRLVKSVLTFLFPCLCLCSLGPETKPVSSETPLSTAPWDSTSGRKPRRSRLYGGKMPKRIRLLLLCPFTINYFFGIICALSSVVHKILALKVYV